MDQTTILTTTLTAQLRVLQTLLETDVIVGVDPAQNSTCSTIPNTQNIISTCKQHQQQSPTNHGCSQITSAKSSKSRRQGKVSTGTAHTTRTALTLPQLQLTSALYASHRQRIRALDLIQKHTPETNAVSHGNQHLRTLPAVLLTCAWLPLQREAQKTRWIVELVMKVDECYRQEMQQQQEQIVSVGVRLLSTVQHHLTTISTHWQLKVSTNVHVSHCVCRPSSNSNWQMCKCRAAARYSSWKIRWVCCQDVARLPGAGAARCILLPQQKSSPRLGLVG